MWLASVVVWCDDEWAGTDKTVKIFDVLNFDMINFLKLDYLPQCCCWVRWSGQGVWGQGVVHLRCTGFGFKDVV